MKDDIKNSKSASGSLIGDELRRLQDKLTTVRVPDVHRQFAESRKNQKLAPNHVANRQAQRRKPSNGK